MRAGEADPESDAAPEYAAAEYAAGDRQARVHAAEAPDDGSCDHTVDDAEYAGGPRRL